MGGLVGGVGTGRERRWILFFQRTIIEFAINVVEGKENLRESREGEQG